MNNKMNDYDYKNIYPFKWFVLQNFPFIEADFDAITNYQLYSKVVEYLNKVIDATNQMGQTVEYFTNYVSTYFENLDVQDEINNKLDEMVESGVLQEIISEYLNSKAIFGYDTVEDMKSATNLINGSFARTMGYHSKNDGGSSLYKIRTLTNEDVIDNMFIISLNTENLIAELVNVGNILNAKQLGAYGDDIHDDLIPLQKLIDLSEKYTIIIPKGIYLISENLVIFDKSNLVIHAEDSEIHYSGSDYAIKVSKTKDSEFNFGTINSPSGGCIKLESLLSTNWVQYININFLLMKSLTNCIHSYVELGWVNEIRINNGRLQAGEIGVLLENNRDASSIESYTLTNLGFEGITNAVVLRSTQGSISRVRIENCRYAELITYSGKLLICEGTCERIRIVGDVNIQNALLNIPNTVTDCILQAPCVFFSNVYVKGGYFKNGLFIPNESNTFDLIDGRTVELNSDFNNLVEPGNYIMTGSVASSMLNRPQETFSQPARLLVVSTYSSPTTPQSPNTRAMQILFTGTLIFTRRISKSSGTYTFSNWSQVQYVS